MKDSNGRKKYNTFNVPKQVLNPKKLKNKTC